MGYEEGLAVIDEGSAFLNPLSRFPRDMSVAILSCFSGKKTLLDSTSATGIRGIRYAKELGIENATFLDINKEASISARKNLSDNGIRAEVLNESIQSFANSSEERFDIIDLDPFGSPVPNLYDLMKIGRDGTIFLVSATDTAVLCGAQPEACMKMYGSVPLHDELCHEAGLRILIGYCARISAQFNYGIDVIFSFSYRHMMRIAFVLRHGAANSSSTVHSLGFAYHCMDCRNIDTKIGFIPKQSVCRACGAGAVSSGIMWLGPLYDEKVRRDACSYFVRSGFPDAKIASMISEETDSLFYYSLPVLTKIARMPSVSPGKVISSLREGGFSASLTHMEKESIRTSCPIGKLMDVIASLA
jgi:tRNA (guanine26-N2/guanine27-N2)-dimethyltransferase